MTMKTVMERSHIPLHKWLLGFHLFTASKKGFSAHRFHRTLWITYRSAWFMAHRTREAMRAGGLEPLGVKAKSLRPTRPILVTYRRPSARLRRAVGFPSRNMAEARTSGQSFR